jgi:hypothetical protein
VGEPRATRSPGALPSIRKDKTKHAMACGRPPAGNVLPNWSGQYQGGAGRLARFKPSLAGFGASQRPISRPVNHDSRTTVPPPTERHHDQFSVCRGINTHGDDCRAALEVRDRIIAREWAASVGGQFSPACSAGCPCRAPASGQYLATGRCPISGPGVLMEVRRRPGSGVLENASVSVRLGGPPFLQRAAE